MTKLRFFPYYLFNKSVKTKPWATNALQSPRGLARGAPSICLCNNHQLRMHASTHHLRLKPFPSIPPSPEAYISSIVPSSHTHKPTRWKTKSQGAPRSYATTSSTSPPQSHRHRQLCRPTTASATLPPTSRSPSRSTPPTCAHSSTLTISPTATGSSAS